MSEMYVHDPAALRAAADRVRAANEVDVTGLRTLALSMMDLVTVATDYLPGGMAADGRDDLAGAVLDVTLKWAQEAYWDETCGDCVEGRCHWGGETSARSIELAKAGGDYEDPTFGTCGCARHKTSVLARGYVRETHEGTVLAWQAAKDLGEIEGVWSDDPGEVVWVSRGTLTVDGEELTDETIDRLAAEAEQGYDVAQLRERPRADQP